MDRSRFLWKLFAGYAVLIVLTAVAIAWLQADRVEQQVIADATRALVRDAEFLERIAAPKLASGEGAGLQAMLTALARPTGERFTIIAPDGRVLAETQEDPERLNNHAGRPEILAAIRTRRVATATRFSDTVGYRHIYAAKAVWSGDLHVGTVRCARAVSDVDDRIHALRWRAAAGAAIAAVVACLLGFLMARHVTEPLNEMRAVADAMAAGDLDAQVHTRASGELGSLATALNSMQARLRNRMDALTQEQNKLHSILEAMVEGVLATDGNQRIVHVNDVAARILGIDAANSSGQILWEATRFPKIADTVAHTLEHGDDISSEITIPAIGENRFIRIHASPIHDASATITGAVVVLFDVSELRRLEKVRRDFVSNVSHELKTPLTAIRGIAETLSDDPDMPAATRTRFLQHLREQSCRLEALVVDVLRLSRVETEDAAFAFETIDLRTVFGHSVRDARAAADSKHLDLTLSIPDEPVLASADREAMRQVADNLLQNAIRYTGDGIIHVRLTVESDQAVLSVQDSGMGIEPEHLDRIFERFYRADRARTRASGGTGLGLSIVKNIVLAHGGRVDVQSEVGVGTTFRVHLPLTNPSNARTTQ